MKGKYLVAISLTLLFPLVCYYIVRTVGGDGHVKLPKFYGKIDSVKAGKLRGKAAQDTFWHSVDNFEATNQLGKQVNIPRDIPGKYVVLNFMFTTCNTTCPVLTGNLKFLQDRYKKADSLLGFASITVDPASDSVPALRAYANRFHANHDKWWFCNAPDSTVQHLMYDVLMLPDLPPKADAVRSATNHSNVWVLLDEQRLIRGYYNALDTLEMRRCADDISLLILEKKKKHFSNEQ